MLIRMRVTMSGGRYDHRDWPPYGQLIDVPDWEGNQLIAAGNAESYEEPELDRGYDVLKVPHPEYETILKRADGSDQAGEEEEDEDLARDEPEEIDYEDDFERDDDDNEVEQSEIKKPYTNAPKDAWIEYAASKGADRKQVAELTKAQIIAKFGG